MRTEPSFSSDEEKNFDNSVVSPYLDDYRQRYGLSCDPFADDPHFPFYTGAQRRLILEKLVHLCQFANNLLVVLGEYSTGKTRMAQALIDSLEDEDDICFIEGQITSRYTDLLDEIVDQFELENSDDLTEFFEKSPNTEGVAVVIVDNAHHLADDVLKELVLLMQPNTESRLRLVFLGEPLLLQRLEQMDVSHVVMSDFTLERFDLAEAIDYLNFRMEMSDYLGPELFNESNVESWWRSANGQIDRLHACAQQKLLESVSSSNSRAYAKSGFSVTHILAVAVLASILMMGFFYLGRDTDKPKVNNGLISSSLSSVPQLAAQIPVSNVSSSINSTAQSNNSVALQTSNEVPVVVNNTVITSSQDVSAKDISSANNISVGGDKVSTISTGSKLDNKTRKANSSAKVIVTTDQDFATTNDSVSASSVAKRKEIKSTKSNLVDDGSKVSAESASETTAEFTDQERTILSWDDSEHTLQIVGVSSEKSAKEFIANQINKKDLLFFKTTRQGKDWFVVVCGHYATVAEAHKALTDLPDAQQKANPWSRTVKVIKKEIRSR